MWGAWVRTYFEADRRARHARLRPRRRRAGGGWVGDGVAVGRSGLGGGVGPSRVYRYFGFRIFSPLSIYVDDKCVDVDLLFRSRAPDRFREST